MQLDDRIVPTTYKATQLSQFFPGKAEGLTPDGFYNSPEGIRRINAGVIIPQTDFLPYSIGLVRSVGSTVVFGYSTDLDSNAILYKTDGPSNSYRSIGDPSQHVKFSDVTFMFDSNLYVYYTRTFHTTGGGGGGGFSTDLYRQLPDGGSSLLMPELIAGHGSSAWEITNKYQLEGFSYLTNFGEELYFVGQAFDTDGNQNLGLYKVSAEGLVTRVGLYPPGASIRGLFPTSVGLLAQIETDDNGLELFAGTQLLKDINPGTAGSFPSEFFDTGSKVYFVADDGIHGREPWVTNGTTASTHMLRDVNPGPDSSSPEDFVSAGQKVFFTASGVDGPPEFGTASGIELWATDGTETGTRLVKDINPGPGNGVGSVLFGIFPVGGGLFAEGDNVLFPATTGRFVDGQPQYDLWQSDGTAAGTRLTLDLAPSKQKDPGSFIRYDQRLYFRTGGIAPATWQLTRQANHPPVVAQQPSDIVARPDQPFAVTLPLNTFSDPDLDNLTYTATTDTGTTLPTWLTFNPNTLAFSGTPKAPGDLGQVRIKVTARDPDGATAAANFSVYVDTITNHAPTVRTPLADLRTQIGFQLIAPTPDGTFVDADIPTGDRLTLSLTLSNGQPLPSWLSFFGDTLEGTPPLKAYSVTTVFQLRITATDQAGATVSNDFSLTIVVPVRPAPAIVYVDQSFFTQTPSDPDGAGPATEYLYDGFNDFKQALDAVASGGTVVIRSGFYFSRGGEGSQGGSAISNNGKRVTIALGSGVDGADSAQVTLFSPLTLDANASLRLSITSAAPAGTPIAGTDYDSLVSFGGITLGGAKLILVGGYRYRAGDTFNLVSFTNSFAEHFGTVDTSALNLMAGTPTVENVGNQLSLTFTPPTVGGLLVQNGLKSRSFVNFLDLTTSSVNLATDLKKPGRMKLTQYDLAGNNGKDVPLGTVGGTGSHVTVDFGVNGVGGNRNSNVGDGAYELAIDVDGDGIFETKRYFYRLLGDVNGDKQVDSADVADVKDPSLAMAKDPSLTMADLDVNGDGIIDSTDLLLVSRAYNKNNIRKIIATFNFS